MRLTRTVHPTSAPISVFDTKKHCRVDHDEEDQYIAALIEAATDYLDGPSGILGRAIMTQTWLLELKEWPATLALPVEPIQSLTVSWLSPDGTETVFDPSRYTLVGNPSARPSMIIKDKDLLPELGAQDFPIRITMVAGWPDANNVPAALKVAMMMMVHHWYERGEVSSGEFPPAISTLLARWRVMI